MNRYWSKNKGIFIAATLIVAALIGYVAYPALSAAGVSGSTISLLLSEAALLCSIYFPILLIVGLMPFWLPRALLAALTSYLLVAYIVADNFHYSFLGQHLFADALSLVVMGVETNQIELEPATWWWVGGSTIAWFALFPVALRLIEKLLIKWRSPLRGSVAFLGVPLLAAQFLAAGVPGDMHSGKELRELLVGHAFLDESVDTPALVEPKFYEGASFNDEVLRQRFTHLLKRRELILKEPLSVERKPNILLLVVEGLRSDVFNAENMPKLYGMKNEWLDLRQHYTSGANSGTGDFGLLTGLHAPYYSILREAWSNALPLEIFKKLGYEMSL